MSTSASELNKGMSGKSCTSGWDMVVSYHRDKLNEVLKRKWDASKQFGSISFDYKRKSGLSNFDFHVDLCFKSPLLSFFDDQIILEVPILGSILNKKKADSLPIVIPPGEYVLRITAALASVSGEVTSGPIDNFAKPPEHVVELHPDAASSSNIVLHITNDDRTYWDIIKIPTAPANTTLDPVMVQITPHIKAWFKKPENFNAIEYRLASVTNAKAPDDPSGLLQPKSFVFSVQGVGAETCLSIYIQTQGSGSASGSPLPKFHPTENRMSPIPKDRTASIIIAHHLFSEKFIKKQITQYMKDNDITQPVEEKSVSSGLEYLFHVKGNYVVPESGNFWKKVEGVDLDMGSTTMQLIIQDGFARFYFEVSRLAKWKHIGFIPGGEADVKITLATRKALAEVTNEEITVNLLVESEKFICKAEGRDGASVPDTLKKINFQIPEVRIKTPSLNFVAASSVLVPGSRIMRVDSSALYTPYDVMIVGWIE